MRPKYRTGHRTDFGRTKQRRYRDEEEEDFDVDEQVHALVQPPLHTDAQEVSTLSLSLRRVVVAHVHTQQQWKGPHTAHQGTSGRPNKPLVSGTIDQVQACSVAHREGS